MTTPSSFQSLGLSIQIEDPIIKTNRTVFERVSERVDSYAHETRAIGGYWSARMRIRDTQVRIEDWIDKGLGRHIVTHNPALEVIFEGFVNKIVATFGTLQFTLGPLMDIGNKVATVYSGFDNSTNPATTGTRHTTSFADNADSQTKYGVIQKVLSLGGAQQAVSEQIRDAWMEEHAEPETSLVSNLSRGREPSVSIEVLGYWHWFKNYIYNDTTTGFQDLDAKIQAVVTADPNSIFSSDFSKITANTLQVDQQDDNNRKAETVLKELNTQGDASLNRYNIGVYANRQVVYSVAPSTITYQQRVTDDNSQVTTFIGGTVKPWDVQPGNWVFYPDFLTGRLPPVTNANFKDDPRVGYVEVAKFTAPNNLNINGEKVSQMNQVLAKYGLLGVGV